MYLAINKANHLEFHNFEWTQDDILIVNGECVSPEDWEIIEVEIITSENSYIQKP
jgi:hypothetical protein